jgi:hypothetical protein
LNARIGRWSPVPEREKTDPFHVRYLGRGVETFGYACCCPVQDSLSVPEPTRGPVAEVERDYIAVAP